MYGVSTKEIERRLPHYSSCCCGCSLRTGSIFIGYLSAAFGILSLILTCSSIVNVWYVTTSPDNGDVASKMTLGLLMTIVIMDTINTILSLLMVTGATIGKAKYLMPWVTFHTLETTVYAVGVVISTSVAFSFGYVTNGFYAIFTGVLITSLQIYCILVVFSLFREMTSEDNHPPKYAPTSAATNHQRVPPPYGSQLSKTELI